MFFRFLFLLYIDALVENKPIAVVPTMVLGGVMAGLVVYGALTEPDPASIGLAIVLGLMTVIVLAVAIIDRKINKKKARPTSSAKRSVSQGGRR